jgi:hypothetical protein
MTHRQEWLFFCAAFALCVALEAATVVKILTSG